MNKLAHGLLSFLSTEPLSGYDLLRRMNYFWPTTHSAIYPLLSELEEDGLVTCALVEQCGKPDKKIYSITGKGRTALQAWFSSETSPAMVRDEAKLKVLCLQEMEAADALRLMDELYSRYEAQLALNTQRLEQLVQTYGVPATPRSVKFGSYVLLKRSVSEAEANLNWCLWMKGFYSEAPMHS